MSAINLFLVHESPSIAYRQLYLQSTLEIIIQMHHRIPLWFMNSTSLGRKQQIIVAAINLQFKSNNIGSCSRIKIEIN